MADELFPGYDEAIASVQVPPAPATGGGLDIGLLQQMLMQMQQPQQATGQPKQMPTWLAFIPGGARGFAQRQQMDAQQEELKLRKQQLAGQEAMHKLQQMQLMQKIEQQQRLKRWGGLYSGLITNEDAMDPQSVQEMEGLLARDLAELGDPDAVQKFLDSRQTAKGLKALNALDQQTQAPAAAAPQGNPGDGAEAALLPPVSSARPQQTAVYEQMAREYAQSVGVDPALAVAVMRTESSGNPQAVGDGGKAVGLFQLHPAAAQDVGLTAAQRKDPQANIRGGVDYLKKQLDATGGNVPAALQRYNGGGTADYAQRVMAQMPAPGAGKAQQNQDALALEGLRQRERQIELYMKQAEPFIQTSPKIKTRYDAKKAELERVQKDMDQIQTRQQQRAQQDRGFAHQEQMQEQSFAQQERMEEIRRKGQVEAARQHGIEAVQLAKDKEYEQQLGKEQAEREKQARGPLPEKKFEFVTGMRKQLSTEDSYKRLKDMEAAYRSAVVGAKRNDGVGDLALSYAIARLVQGDSSTVREGEFANVATAQGALQRYLNSVDTFFRGTRLLPAKRQEFLNAASQMMQEHADVLGGELRAVYEPRAKEMGIPFEEVMPPSKLPAMSPEDSILKKYREP